jgi:uncharacterized protein YjiS (DUF1127 family)
MTKTALALASGLTAAVLRRWEARRAIAMLSRADAALLRDLGISRGGIENAVRHGRADGRPGL